jgi:uncharacterized protein
LKEQNNISKNERILLRISYLFIFILSILALIFGVLNFLAYKGMPEAEAFLGVVYKTGAMTFPQDTKKAKEYLLRAAKKSDAMGQCELGNLYELERNYQLSAYWYLQSSLNGWWRCDQNFEKFDYPDKQGVFIMLKTKADSQNAFAQYLVGKSYIEGKGTEKNIENGINYLRKAALSGSRSAQIHLSGLFIKGEVVKQDIVEANKWLKLIEN